MKKWIDAQAKISNVTRSKKIYDLLAAQRKTQEHLAHVFTGAPEGDEDGKHMLHVLLEQQTETIASSLDQHGKVAHAVVGLLKKLVNMVDLGLYLQLSPQQYDTWQSRIEKLNEGRPHGRKDPTE
jgi:hypothetical protein